MSGDSDPQCLGIPLNGYHRRPRRHRARLATSCEGADEVKRRREQPNRSLPQFAAGYTGDPPPGIGIRGSLRYIHQQEVCGGVESVF